MQQLLPICRGDICPRLIISHLNSTIISTLLKLQSSSQSNTSHLYCCNDFVSVTNKQIHATGFLFPSLLDKEIILTSVYMMLAFIASCIFKKAPLCSLYLIKVLSSLSDQPGICCQTRLNQTDCAAFQIFIATFYF